MASPYAVVSRSDAQRAREALMAAGLTPSRGRTLDRRKLVDFDGGDNVGVLLNEGGEARADGVLAEAGIRLVKLERKVTVTRSKDSASVRIEQAVMQVRYTYLVLLQANKLNVGRIRS